MAKTKLGQNSTGLIACDIDGCLNSGKAQQLDLHSLAKVRAYNEGCCKQETPPITLISGRPQPFVEAFANLLDVNLPCICENGAVMYFPKEDRVSIHSSVTPTTLIAVDALRKQLRCMIADGLQAQMEIGKEVCISLNPANSGSGDALSVEALHEIIATKTDAELFEITHSATAVDITPRGVSKAAALIWLAELVKLGPGHMIGIGDAPGDLQFLHMTGFSGSPANANIAVKQAVNFVSDKPYAMGTLDVLNHILDERLPMH